MGRLTDSIEGLEDRMLSEEFISALESYIPFLREHPESKTAEISLHQAAKFRGDFYGLLNELGWDKKYHLTILRMNGYMSSTDYEGETTLILYPPQNVVDMFFTSFITEVS